MTLLPFEPPYFEAVGLSCSYVGHPVLESGADRGDGPAFRRRHGIPEDAPILCMLPGSRRGEVSRLLPVFREAAERLRRDIPDLTVVVPTVATVSETVRAGWSGVPFARVVEGTAEKYDAFAASTAALAASGTVALELAAAGLPTAVTYRVNRLTAWLVGRVIKVKYANLVNLLLDRLLVPELLMENCTPERLAAEARRLMTDQAVREEQRRGFAAALERLGRGQFSPSRRAAEEVLAAIARHRQAANSANAPATTRG
jgi:lipid-A-disaccharide synthase